MMSNGLWDLHCHLLPGVDDGSSCLEETLHLVNEEWEQGVRNIVLTPHYRPGMFNVSTKDREMVYRRVISELQKRYPDMRFYMGCELHVHSAMLTALLDPRNRLHGSRIVLAEFGGSDPFAKVLGVTQKLIEKGYQPIIAHVERYICMHREESRLYQLKKAGALIQVNAGSILGAEGRRAKKYVLDRIAEDCVDFVASDAHNMTDRPVELKEAYLQIEKRFGTEVADNLFQNNQQLLMRKYQLIK